MQPIQNFWKAAVTVVKSQDTKLTGEYKFSNDTDALETKVNVIDEKATSFRSTKFCARI